MIGQPERIREVRQWIERAEHDLKCAAHTLKLQDDCPFDTVCFHAQQCAEKYLKGLLVFLGVQVPRAHDLRLLLQLAVARVRLKVKVSEVAALNRYTIEARYPGDWEPIDRTEAKAALEIAQKVRQAVRKHLPLEGGKMGMGLWILLGIIVLVGLWFVGGYNQLVRKQQEVKSAWSQIDVQLKRRHDLIPNLVETVKGYIAHERQTLENVTKARTQAASATGLQDKAQAENFLTQTLRSLFAVVERYPDLKANQNVLSLQEELASTENRISFARQYYNDEVARLNTLAQSAPTNVIASLGGFKTVEFFTMEDPSDRQVPQVKF